MHGYAGRYSFSGRIIAESISTGARLFAQKTIKEVSKKGRYKNEFLICSYTYRFLIFDFIHLVISNQRYICRGLLLAWNSFTSRR